MVAIARQLLLAYALTNSLQPGHRVLMNDGQAHTGTTVAAGTNPPQFISCIQLLKRPACERAAN